MLKGGDNKMRRYRINDNKTPDHKQKIIRRTEIGIQPSTMNRNPFCMSSCVWPQTK